MSSCRATNAKVALCAFRYADAFAAVAMAPPEIEEGES